MLAPEKIEAAIKSVNDQTSFIQNLLIDTLGWPIDDAAQVIGDIAYEWSEEELRTEGLTEKIVGGKAYQIILPDNPWGIFVIEFANPDVFTTGRGMTGVLRRVLNGLIRKGRSGQHSNLPSFTQDNLLFICNNNYERYRFTHFKAPVQGSAAPRMSSFGWGPDDLTAVRTLCEFNLKALQWPAVSPASEVEWLNTWSSAFDVVKVTEHFYEDYAEVFREVEDIISKTSPLKGDELRMFTQSLFNRLMFLRFIERKGWLTFPGQSGTRYLATLAAAGGIGKRSLYASRLAPLFFQGLAQEGAQQNDAYGHVPFLNGGLFEKSALDDKVNDIPDEAFGRIFGQDGLFYRYNFTVEESTPLDIEVAVDPEMLGKVFEELVTGRHESGSYYTPRPVVAFMCREALKGHLADRTSAPEAAIAQLVDDHIIDEKAVNRLTDAHGQEIIHALDNLKAVDPACGSGAYLLGLLQELIAIRRVLQNDKLLKDSSFLYNLKLHIISHNLYGVDIDPFATEIAKLRLWLSLAVEANRPVPLPNLDFKIETGDAVSGPDPGDMPDLFQLELNARADALVRKKHQFLQAHGKRKADLREEIIAAENLIRERLEQRVGVGIIDWRVQFAEVFAKLGGQSHTMKGEFAFMADAHDQHAFLVPSQAPSETAGGGFDIVMANPPYIRQELIKALKPTLKNVYKKQFVGTADLYVFFYLRGLQLLAPGGMLVYISSNKWFRAGYGEKLRAHIAKTTTVQTIIDFHDLPVFKAIAYPMIFIASKRVPADNHTATLVEPPDLEPPYPDVKKVVSKYGHTMPKSALGREGTWHLATSSAADRLAKMRRAGPALNEVVGGAIHAGIKTGFNTAFWIDKETRDMLIAKDAASAQIIKPMIVGRDLRRWGPITVDRWIIFIRRGAVDIQKYPAILSHLNRWKQELTPKVRSDDSFGRKPGSYKWYELQDNLAYFEKFSKPKIVFPDISPEPRFTLDEQNMYPDMTAFMIASADIFLLAVLNSRIVLDFYTAISSQVRGGFLRYKRQYLEQIPIPYATDGDRNVIAGLAQKCLDARGIGCESWEKEIDDRVAALYGIDLEDIQRP